MVEQVEKSIFMDREEVKQILSELNTRMQFVPDPLATAEQSQEMMAAQGIRAEDNIGSCGIIAAREAA